MKFHLVSAAFEHASYIPGSCTCDGENVSPELSWSHAPEGAQSFALIIDDPDAPGGTFTHWVLFDLPAGESELARGSSGAAKAGKNDFQQDGYGGPCPPPNDGDHRYFFRIYALDVPSLGLETGAKREQVEAAMEGHVLAEAELMGRYERRTA